MPLTRGFVGLADPSDITAVSDHVWHANFPKHARSAYVCTNVSKRPMSLHRMLISAAPGEIVDHINGNGCDNRRANLRLCTHAENMRNRKKSRGGNSKHKGIYYEPNKQLWRAEIKFQGKKIRLGRYKSADDAALAYRAAAQRYHGNFARLE